MGAGVQVFTSAMTRVRRNGEVLLLTATQYHYGLAPVGATPDSQGGYSFARQGGAPRLRPSSLIAGLGAESRNPYGVGMDKGAGSLNPIGEGMSLRAHAGLPQKPDSWV